MSRADVRVRFLTLLLLTIVPAAQACEEDLVPLFACEAANGRKFVELCASSPLDAESGSLVHRFGALGADGTRSSVEPEYPKERAGSLQLLRGYLHASRYLHPIGALRPGPTAIRFSPAQRVCTIGCIEVRDRRTGKSTVIACSERPVSTFSNSRTWCRATTKPGRYRVCQVSRQARERATK